MFFAFAFLAVRVWPRSFSAARLFSASSLAPPPPPPSLRRRLRVELASLSALRSSWRLLAFASSASLCASADSLLRRSNSSARLDSSARLRVVASRSLAFPPPPPPPRAASTTPPRAVAPPPPRATSTCDSYVARLASISSTSARNAAFALAITASAIRRVARPRRRACFFSRCAAASASACACARRASSICVIVFSSVTICLSSTSTDARLVSSALVCRSASSAMPPEPLRVCSRR